MANRCYPLDDATWIQQPGQINVVFGGVQATLAAEGGTCQAYVQLLQNGEEVGGGQLSTDSETLVTVEGSLGANPQIDPVDGQDQHPDRPRRVQRQLRRWVADRLDAVPGPRLRLSS